MSASTTFTRPVGHLGASLDSKVVLPGDERFDEARRAWNLAIDQRPEAVDAFVNAAGPGAAFPLLTAEIRHLGGEFARPRPGNGALACVNAGYILHAAGMTPVPELAGPVTAQIETIKGALAPWAARQMYLNFAETQHPGASFWSEQAYRRLRRIKADVDPDDVIRSNHPIPPAR